MAKKEAGVEGFVQEFICYGCEHYMGYSEELKKPICFAFLDGIPDVIRNGENFHEEKMRGQEGDFIYTPVED